MVHDVPCTLMIALSRCAVLQAAFLCQAMIAHSFVPFKLWSADLHVLQEWNDGKRLLLFDPVTRLLYTPPADPSTGWPELCARLDSRGNVQAVNRPRPRDLFNKLDQYLKTTRVRLNEVGITRPGGELCMCRRQPTAVKTGLS